jgi:hypothetical protein
VQVIEKVRDDLAYRLPAGDGLKVVILSREQAERLVAEWDALTQEGPSMSERAVLWIVTATLALAIVVILGLAYGRSARSAEQQQQRVACSSQKNGGGYWSWREVDGRRCWYPGRAGKSKTELHWSRMLSIPPDAKPAAVERPGANVPAPGPLSTGEEVVQDGRGRAQHNTLPASSEARALTPEEEELLTTYWPDLAEFEARSVGLKSIELPAFEPLRLTTPPPPRSSWSWLWVFLVPLGYIGWVYLRTRLSRQPTT